jgi:repressor LexA
MSRTDGTNDPIPFPRRALLKSVPPTHTPPQTRQPLTDFSPPTDAAEAPGGESGVREQLTDRQRQILDFISESLRRRGYPPTLREIGERMGIRSTNGVNDHLKALEKKGYLQRQDLKSRALRVIDPKGPAGHAGHAAAETTTRFDPVLSANDDNTVEVPLLGRVAAGQPILALEQREDTVKVDRFFLGGHRDVFALRIQGDSMIEAGIHDGDFIFVKKQATARTGDIVVAMINDEATVKYFHPEADRILFKPANSRLSPIEVKKSDFKPVNLLGTVVGVYRRVN